jgi:hypothetical protein
MSEAKFESGEGSLSLTAKTPHPPLMLCISGTLSHKGRG